MKSSFAGLGVALLSVVSTVQAEVTPTTGEVVAPERPTMTAEHARAMLKVQFQNFDCENVGFIHAGEVDDHFAQLWLPNDADSDRLLTDKEYRRTHAGSAEAHAAMFAHADRDGSGAVSFNEMRNHLFDLIAVLDDDGDGEINRIQAGLGPDPYAMHKLRLLMQQRMQKTRAANAASSAEQEDGDGR